MEDIYKFLSNFSYNSLYITNNRQTTIANLQKYTPEEFLKYEDILNDMFWNMKEKLMKKFKKKVECKVFDYITEQDIKQKKKEILRGILYYRSFINKIILVDIKNKKIYYKPFQASISIASKSKLDLLCNYLLFNRELYEKIINDTNEIKNVILPKYYYELDYLFPNLNYCKRNINDVETRLRKIKYMYYDKDGDENWFKLFY